MTTKFAAPPLERQAYPPGCNSSHSCGLQTTTANSNRLNNLTKGGRKKRLYKGGEITLVQTSNPAGINTGNQVENTTKTYVGAQAAATNDSLVAPAQPIKTASGGRRRRKITRKQKKSYSRKSHSKKGRKRKTIKKR